MGLAFAVHAVLVAVMFLGVRWQSHPAESVSVELWDPPPPPPPAPVVLEKPKPPPPPPPKVEPAKPEPQVKKPDIVEKAPPPKPKPKPKPEAKPKPVPPKDDEFQKRMAKEQLAMEQRSIDEERRRVEEERRRADEERRKAADEERRRVDEARRKADSDRVARELASTARNRALGEYVNAIQRKVRQNWILPQDLQGNPEAVFDVVQLPTGDVIRVTIAKSSGNAAYDEAVHRAILKSTPLPLPEPRSLFSRELKLTFRPRD